LRILWLALLALLIEVGWLALWPLAGTLSHSPAFNAAFLDSHEPARRLLESLLDVARPILPDLAEAPLTEPLGTSTYFASATALAILMGWVALGYLAALTLLDRGLGAARAAVWVVVGAALVFQSTLLFLPGLFSQDVFSYIAYGHLAAIYDLNPYIWPPSAIGKDAVVPWVADVWRSYASPYGPVWTDVQWAIARVFGGRSVADEALVYRVLANVLLLANLGLVWLLLGRVTPLNRSQRTTALAALAWNPLVLFEVAGNGHNDVLMVSFSLLALLLLTRSNRARFMLAGASFTLGALVKYLAGLGLVWLAVAVAARPGSWTRRTVRLGLMALVSTVIVLGVMGPWLELPDSLDPLAAETAGVGYVNDLPDTLALAVTDQILAPAGVQMPFARELSRGVERFLVLLAFGAYLVWEFRQVLSGSDPEHNVASVARASARSCLIYVLVVSTSVQTWYFCLPVSLAVVLGWRATFTRVTVAYSLLALPALYLNYYLRESTPLWVAVVYGLAPLVLALPTRARTHEPAADVVGDDEQRAGRHRVPGAIVKQARR
jgi:Dolichyl-phosphate-mannose-protein mannosyltransferase